MKLKAEVGGVDIEDGTYKVTVLRVEEAVYEDSRFGEGPRTVAKFTFGLNDILDDDAQPIELTANASAKLTPKSKLWGWFEALMGEPPTLDQEVDLDILIACEALARVANEPDRDDPRIKWARIKELMALPKPAPKAAAKGKTSAAYEGFLNTEGGVNWDAFMKYANKAGVGTEELASAIKTEKLSQKAITDWIQAEPGRTLTGLVAIAKGPAQPEDEIPFE